MKGKKTLSGALLFAVSFAAFGQQSSSTLASASRYECTTACSATDPSPYCMVAPRDAKLASALSQLRQRLAAPTPSRLSSADLMRFFDVKDDPCTRSDTVRENGVWANKGAACLLSVNVDVFPGTSSVPIRIHIPSEILFTATQQADWLKITPRRTATVLEINDANLHNDWGGTVLSVHANATSALFQMPRGCIKIPL